MGGSILGSEAIYEFSGKMKIKKKIFFFNDYRSKKNIKNLKKKNDLSKILFYNHF